MVSGKGKPPAHHFWPYDVDKLLTHTAALEGLQKEVGAVNPRPPGWHNALIQFVKSIYARSLGWYTRPLRAFNASVTHSLEEMAAALDHLSMNMVSLDQLSLNMIALEGRLAQLENRNAAHLEAQVAAPSHVDTGVGADRTTYLIGLFGSGRHYVNELIRRHLGERAKYFRDTIRLHPGPTPMIYSGHATIRHVSRELYPPEVMRYILEAVTAGFADLVFIYRHPLDSLLTNWVWWRRYLRDRTSIFGISRVYQSNGELCADVERNFDEFQAFAEGDPEFYRSAPGPRFLSFPEFVEETELHLAAATLALRLEDFIIDPRKEFSKIVSRMSSDVDVTQLTISPPETKSYGYLTVQKTVPRFRSYIDGLDAETKRRITQFGYDL